MLSTKVRMLDTPRRSQQRGSGREAIYAQLDASLRRLRADCVDIYWMHRWDRHTPLEETRSSTTWSAAGRFAASGLSTPAWWVAQAATTAQLRGWEGVAALQVEYSLSPGRRRGSSSELRAVKIGVLHWSPLASGMLSGKYSRTASDHGDSRLVSYAAAMLGEWEYAVLERISGELETTAARVALAWVRQQPIVTSGLGARTMAQLEDNLASAGVVLSDEELAEFDGLTTPTLDYPAAMLGFVTGYQQGNNTINGVASRWRRPATPAEIRRNDA